MVCVDVGSTWTKAALVRVPDGELVATSAVPTTAGSDVLHGLGQAVALLGPAAVRAPVRACSSAGGGLRIAVLGQERLITADAGRRVALTAGGHIVHVAWGPLDTAGIAALRRSRPDVLLFAGGTDGGDEDVVRHNAARLAAARFRVPTVFAGNAACAGFVREVLPAAVVCGNIVPRLGVLDPAPARDALRAMFLRHVIGGRGLSRGRRFGRLVRAATPDAVLTAVILLAETPLAPTSHTPSRDLIVIDVGGATTDVYSAVSPDPARARPAAGVLWCARTVEGDLGLRAGAPGVIAAARTERLLAEDGATAVEEWERAAAARSATPAYLPATAAERAVDERLAALALTVALRRHARHADAGVPRNLRAVTLVVGSGGVLRHHGPAALHTALTDHAGGWALPAHPHVSVDAAYVLAAAGLLAPDHPEAARRLLARALAPA
ncbi:glutamate mutase L [Catenuloplanes sp. NPDC051500]|uniref:glutamate mutase L n=1 Tax=Catenuloplanes sp. NPDC051500 TaxID=3363959 RepID=UPI00379A3E43